jgi:hypothetical protein
MIPPAAAGNKCRSDDDAAAVTATTHIIGAVSQPVELKPRLARKSDSSGWFRR